MPSPSRRPFWIAPGFSVELSAALARLAQAFELDPNLALARVPLQDRGSLAPEAAPGARLVCEPIDPFAPCGQAAEVWALEQPSRVLNSLSGAVFHRPEPGACFQESLARQAFDSEGFSRWQAHELGRSVPASPPRAPRAL